MQNQKNPNRFISAEPTLPLKQLYYKKDSWKHIIGGMVKDNVCLKMRLSLLLKNNFNPNLLEDAENFQNRFLKTDQLIALLRSDMADLEEVLSRMNAEDWIKTKNVNESIKTIMQNINAAGMNFNTLKMEFNDYMKKYYGQ